MAQLFVYGTLLHPELLARLLGRVPEHARATVADHRAAPLAGRVYPGLVPEVGSTAPGSVLLDVTAAEVDVLDRFEGREYVRTTVRARTTDGPVDCDAWLLVESVRHLVEPGAWSFKRFVADHAHEFLGGSRAGSAHPGAGS